ncbi:MAG: PAS domain-containing protein [Gammaproteobacteria bacterium]|nr:PAS domain-containing protein [Gammaproteobacteria bacterium]
MATIENNTDALTQQIDSLKSVLNEVGGYIYMKDLDGCYTFANTLVLDFFGLSREELMGENDDFLFDLSVSNELRKTDLKVMNLGEAIEKEETIVIKSTDEALIYWSVKKPLRDAQNKIIGMCGISTDITARKQAEAERESLLEELKEALAEVKHLQGIIPICSYCHNIRDEEGAWNKLETYISQHSMANLSHGVCPQCLDKVLSDYSSKKH